MHRIIIRAVGKPNEPWHPQAIHSFLQRLRPFAKIELIELAEGHAGSAKPDERKTRAVEAEALLRNLPPETFIIALDETGTNLSSPALARKLDDWTSGGRPLVFLLGGSWGLDAAVRARTNFTLSFGQQTLPHLLARIVLLEQLYRAETILTGKTYHK